MRLRDSVTNMLGEFVALQKTPDFKIRSASNQEINKAIKEEKAQFKERELVVKPRARSQSVRDSCEGDVCLNPAGIAMRAKKSSRRQRPTSLIERFYKRVSISKKGEAISEEDEYEKEAPRKLTTTIIVT